MNVRRVTSDALRPDEVVALRALFDQAWSDADPGFSEEDHRNAFGGVHFLVEEEEDGRIVSHGSVVARELRTGGHRLSTGYVEAVATSPQHQHRGYASAIMREAGEHIDRAFELGALDTGIPGFYEPMGWFVWKGPTFVWMDRGPEATPDEDGSVLVRLTPTTPELDPTEPITCDWREGDVW